jgi:hypothetical protein
VRRRGLHQRALGATEQLGVAIGGADVELGAALPRELAADSERGRLGQGARGQARKRGEPPDPAVAEALARARSIGVE